MPPTDKTLSFMQFASNKDPGLFALAPGSPIARAKGCICAATDGTDDAHNFDCPLHGLEALGELLGMNEGQDKPHR